MTARPLLLLFPRRASAQILVAACGAADAATVQVSDAAGRPLATAKFARSPPRRAGSTRRTTAFTPCRASRTSSTSRSRASPTRRAEQTLRIAVRP